MLRMQTSICVDSSVDAVWKSLARLEDIQIWSDAVQTAHCPPGKSQGVGAERVCSLAGGIILTEYWTAWHEGESFTYEGRGLPLVKVARNKWTLVLENGKTRMESEAEVEFKGGIWGRLLEPFFSLMMKGMVPGTFSRLKFYIEQHRAYDKGRDILPKRSAVC